MLIRNAFSHAPSQIIPIPPFPPIEPSLESALNIIEHECRKKNYELHDLQTVNELQTFVQNRHDTSWIKPA